TAGKGWRVILKRPSNSPTRLLACAALPPLPNATTLCPAPSASTSARDTPAAGSRRTSALRATTSPFALKCSAMKFESMFDRVPYALRLTCRPRVPFLPERRVGKQLDVNTADDRARLEADLLAVDGAVPVCERDAARRLVDEAIEGHDQRPEVGLRLGERRRPDRPVELGVGLPVVERE